MPQTQKWAQVSVLFCLLWCVLSACHIHLDTEGRIVSIQCLNGVRSGPHLNTSCLNKETGEQEQCKPHATTDHTSGYHHECKIHYTKEKDKNYEQMVRTYSAWAALAAFYSPGLDAVGIKEGFPFWKDGSQVLYSFRCSSDMRGVTSTEILFSPDLNASSANSTLRASGLKIYVDNYVRFSLYLQLMAGVLLFVVVCVVFVRWVMMNLTATAADADPESQFQGDTIRTPAAFAQNVMHFIGGGASRRKPSDKRV